MQIGRQQGGDNRWAQRRWLVGVLAQLGAGQQAGRQGGQAAPTAAIAPKWHKPQAEPPLGTDDGSGRVWVLPPPACGLAVLSVFFARAYP